MKILHILGFYPEIGGPYFLMRDIFLKLIKDGVKIHILSPLPHNYDINKIENNVLKAKYIEEGWLAKVIPSYSNRWHKVINENLSNADIFHIHGVFDHYLLVAYKLLSKKPFIISPHGTLMPDAFKLKGKIRKNLYLGLVARKILRKASAIHLLNECEKIEFMKVSRLNNLNSKIFIIPPGIEIPHHLPEHNKFKKMYPKLYGKRYILFLSRLHPIKGLDLFIRAFYLLSKEYSDLYAVIAGPDTIGYGKKIERWLKMFGILDKVIFTGMLLGEVKLSAFVDAELFVLPSYSEGFPIIVLEAMSCKVPVVISNKSGITREVEENKAGIVVDTTPESIYKGIKILLENKNIKTKIVENGRKMVENYYNIEKVTKEMIKMYEKILKR